jgi:molybdenum cofactor cytidylyltransferase
MPLTSEYVHRPEKVSEMLGLSGEHRLSVDDVASVLLSGEGGRKGVPPGAEFRVLLNKAVDPRGMNHGREIAALLLRSAEVNAVIIASLQKEDPVREVWGQMAGIILAAGGSSRLGKPKQLVEWRGRPLVWYSARAALEAGLSPVVIVMGSAAEGVRSALQGEEVSFVLNPHWDAGQSSSIRTGLAALPPGVEAAVFLLSDMPLVNADLVTALVAEHRRTMGPIVAPRAGNEWASPVLFDRTTFPALRELVGDHGGKSLFGRFSVVAVPCDADLLLDIDTEDDVQRLRDRE